MKKLKNLISKNIIGHDILDVARFSKNTSHMIILDALSEECLVCNKGERMRLFLSSIGYENALACENEGSISIIYHSIVKKGIVCLESGTF